MSACAGHGRHSWLTVGFTGLLACGIGLACGDGNGNLDDDSPVADDDFGAGDGDDSGIVLQACPTPRPNAEMLLVSHGDGTRFCIDRYEVHLLGGDLGDTVQSDSGTDMHGNGSTTATVGSAAGAVPLAGVSWYQALALCANSGGQLCRQVDWERACQGPAAWRYPYGDSYEERRCNDFAEKMASGQTVRLTGSFEDCQSSAGVYDLSGNLEEWVYEATALPGTETLNQRYRRGGSYQTNTAALQCVGEELIALPNEPATDRGFRCCVPLAP